MSYDIAGVRRALPLPELLGKLGLGNHAKVKARCPWPAAHKHGDRNPSFSVTETGKGWFWKCHACCGHGDEIDFLAKWFSLSKGDAIRRYAELAGIAPKEEAGNHKEEAKMDVGKLWEWCVEALTDEQLAKLAKWRGYSVEFCRWLRERELVGLYEGRIAFPIHGANGTVAGIHYRKKEDGSWRVYPAGCAMRALVIGDTATADLVLAFESQWDALAVAEKLPGWMKNAHPPVVATRGAANGRLLAGLVKTGAVLMAWRQNDDAAVKWLADAAQHAGCEVRLVLTPEPHKDANDWTKAGATVAELSEAMDAARAVVIDAGMLANEGAGDETSAVETATTTENVASVSARSGDTPWPTLDKAALYGLAGDVVQAIEPHTESDGVALLAQFLAAFGNCINGAPHYQVEATKHRGNLFVCLVGKSSKARKGTSWGHVRRLFEDVDLNWCAARKMSGLSTGEGLVWAVRDPIMKRVHVKGKNGEHGHYEEVVDDEGIGDKRLMVVESEFASVLKQLERDGNTLSAVLRLAWDGEDLRTMSKNSPATATGAHISVIGHITREELLRRMTETDAANGFANRFLWLCVQRSKLLPDGGRIEEVDLEGFVERLKRAVDTARKAARLKRDEAARARWHEIYRELADAQPGLAGAISGRAEAQVLRLSCLYALLDGEATVRVPHLEAALALWKYAAASVRYIFGDKLGDPLADEIRRALAENVAGLTRTEIHKLVGNNRRAEEIDRALALLAEFGLATSARRETRGRSAEVWVTT